MRLDGKVAIVTGSTRGIGAAIARELASNGARVVVSGRSTEDGAAVAKAIRAGGGEASFVGADVNDDEEAKALVDATVERYGGLTTLVNNAGPTDLVGPNGTDGRLAAIPLESFERVLRGGLFTMVHCCRHAIPRMLEAGTGSIVNISSAASVLGVAGMAGYSAAKAGMNGLSRHIAVAYGPTIRSNTLLVGNVDNGSATQARVRSDPAVLEVFARLSVVPLGELGDVAPAVVYLASDESRFMTAATVALDGGLTGKMALPG